MTKKRKAARDELREPKALHDRIIPELEQGLRDSPDSPDWDCILDDLDRARLSRTPLRR